jgi:CHAT domain-containing protein/tetratricopeptide (TPR) repeat protein
MANHTIDELINRGDVFLRNGEFQQAITCYQNAREISPNNIEAIYSLGCVASRSGDYQKAESYARTALGIDKKHKESRLLLGNALFGRNRYQEALDEFIYAAPPANDFNTKAQIGLLHEKLGHWSKAENIFRNYLEHESLSYNSRYSTIGLHDYKLSNADILHALGRVMQHQGDKKEAWLYYHLAKRNDPLLDIDPMFLDILTYDDLENHPYFDDPEADLPLQSATTQEIIRYLLNISDYTELVVAAQLYDINDKADYLVDLIEHAQFNSMFVIAARLRVLYDLAKNVDAEAAFKLTSNTFFSSLIKIAEGLSKQDIGEQDGKLLAARIIIPPELITAMADMAFRFLRKDLKTSYPFLFIFRACCINKQDRKGDALSAVMLGSFYYKNKSYREAIECLETACLLINDLKLYDYAIESYEDYCYALQGLKIESAAIAAADEFIRFAENGPDMLKIASLVLKGNLFTNNHSFKDSLACFQKAMSFAVNLQNFSYNKIIAEALTYLYGNLNTLVPENIVAFINRTEADQDPIFRLQKTALEKSEVAAYREAILLLMEANQVALSRNRYSEMGEINLQLGQNQRLSGIFEDAIRSLDYAVQFAKQSLNLHLLSDIYFELALSHIGAGKKEKAIEVFETGLKEARKINDSQRMAEFHQLLAHYLIDIDGSRAVEHMGRFLELNRSSEKAIDPLDIATDLYNNGDYKQAAANFALLIADNQLSGKKIAFAHDRLGMCYFALNDYVPAKKQFKIAISLTSDQPLFDVYINSMIMLAAISVNMGGAPATLLGKIDHFIKNIKSPGLKRDSYVKAAENALRFEWHQWAETWALAGLHITTSTEWKDLNDEMKLSSILGKVYRYQGFYQQALDTYQKAIIIAQVLKNEPEVGRLTGWKAVAHKYLFQYKQALNAYKEAIKVADIYRIAHDAALHRLNMSQLLIEIDKKDEAIKELSIVLEICQQENFDDIAIRAINSLVNLNYIALLPEHLYDYATTIKIKSSLNADAGSWSQDFDLTTKGIRLIEKGRTVEGSAIIDNVIKRQQTAGDKYNEACSFLNRARSLIKRDFIKGSQDIDSALSIAKQLGQQKLELECKELILENAIQNENDAIVDELLPNILIIWDKMRRDLPEDQHRIAFANHIASLAEMCINYFIARGMLDMVFNMLEWSRALALSDMINRTSTDLKVVQFEQLGSLIEENTFVFYLFFLQNQLLCMVCEPRKTSPEMFNLNTGEEDIETLFRTFELEMYESKGEGFISWTDSLAQLIMPVLGRYLNYYKSLVLVVEGIFQSIPFACLPFDGGLLQEKVRISSVPSLTVLRELKLRKLAYRINEKPVTLSIGVAFPDEALAITRFTGGSTSAITGNNLPKDQIRTFLEKPHDIIHFSGHAHFDPDVPLFSGLHLRSPSSKDIDHILSVNDLVQWDFQANLFVLSACETGLGKDDDTEFIGLSRALLSAGVNCVLCTLWKVNALQTRAFMLLFYENMAIAAVELTELDIAEILRKTQVTLAANNDFYHWAGFQITGDPVITIKNKN